MFGIEIVAETNCMFPLNAVIRLYHSPNLWRPHPTTLRADRVAPAQKAVSSGVAAAPGPYLQTYQSFRAETPPCYADLKRRKHKYWAQQLTQSLHSASTR